MQHKRESWVSPLGTVCFNDNSSAGMEKPQSQLVLMSQSGLKINSLFNSRCTPYLSQILLEYCNNCKFTHNCDRKNSLKLFLTWSFSSRLYASAGDFATPLELKSTVTVQQLESNSLSFQRPKHNLNLPNTRSIHRRNPGKSLNLNALGFLTSVIQPVWKPP